MTKLLASEKLRVGLKVLANVLKAEINADLSASTGALRWQGAKTQRLEVGAGLGKKIRTAGSPYLIRARYGERSIPRPWAEEYRDAFKIFVLVRASYNQRYNTLRSMVTDAHFRRTRLGLRKLCSNI